MGSAQKTGVSASNFKDFMDLESYETAWRGFKS
jgi:hypothetical protein